MAVKPNTENDSPIVKRTSAAFWAAVGMVLSWVFGVAAKAFGWETGLEAAFSEYVPIASVLVDWLFSGYSAALGIAVLAWLHGYRWKAREQATTLTAKREADKVRAMLSNAEYGLGRDMIRMGERLGRIFGRNARLSIEDIADLRALDASMRKAGLQAPPIESFIQPVDPSFATGFFITVGKLLEAHHADDAKEVASQLVERWPQRDKP